MKKTHASPVAHSMTPTNPTLNSLPVYYMKILIRCRIIFFFLPVYLMRSLDRCRICVRADYIDGRPRLPWVCFVHLSHHPSEECQTWDYTPKKQKKKPVWWVLANNLERAVYGILPNLFRWNKICWKLIQLNL